jgi:hypothetical protein
VVRGGCDLVPLPVIREYRDTLPGAKLVTVSGPVTASPPITQGCTAACCSVS